MISGHLNIETIRIAKAKLQGIEEEVTIIKSRVTPIMKSEVYDVCLAFNYDGEYINDASKYDCPNGWLF